MNDIFAGNLVRNNAVTRDLDRTMDRRSVVRVKELCERDRRRVLMHFLALGDADRLLRFGSVLPDELMTRYVQRMDFTRDTIFGVLSDVHNGVSDSAPELLGVGHLAFAPRTTFSVAAGVTQKDRVAEFGLSVSEAARGRGIGTKLFERAVIRCRDKDVDTLIMRYLTSNLAMTHIAEKANLEVHHDHADVEAYLKISPAKSGNALQEAADEHVATVDCSVKPNAKTVGRWSGNSGSNQR